MNKRSRATAMAYSVNGRPLPSTFALAAARRATIASAILLLSCLFSTAWAQKYRLPGDPPTRLSKISCQALFRLDQGLTTGGWRTVSEVPLDNLTPEEVRDLRSKLEECQKVPGITFDQREAIRRTNNGLDNVEAFTFQRVRNERLAENKRLQDEAERALFNEAQTMITAALRRVAAQAADKECQPQVNDIKSEIAARVGMQIFDRETRQSKEWRVLEQECQTRAHRAFEAKRKEEELKKGLAIAARFRAVLDYATSSASKHQARLLQSGLPNDILDHPIILKPHPLTAALLAGFDIQQITVAQWIAMTIEAQPAATISTERDRNTKDWGFGIKIPGSRTVTFFLHADGGELFPSQLKIGDTTYPVETDEDHGVVSNLLVNNSDLATILYGQNVSGRP